MSLKPSTKAPNFTLKNELGKSLTLSNILAIKPVVLFFYPKAFTTGCTLEVCAFRDDYSFFEEHNIGLIGISNDSADVQHKFHSKYKLPYTLLSDPARKVCALYDAVYPLGILTKRTTYLIDKKGIIRSVYSNLFGAESHLLEMKKQILKLNLSGIAA